MIIISVIEFTGLILAILALTGLITVEIWKRAEKKYNHTANVMEIVFLILAIIGVILMIINNYQLLNQ